MVLALVGGRVGAVLPGPLGAVCGEARRPCGDGAKQGLGLGGRLDAREYFEGVAAAARSLRAAELELEFGPAARGGGGGGPADPVLSRALADEGARARAAAARRALDEARARVAWLRPLCGRKADALELRYVRLMAWDVVGAELGVDGRTARRWRDELCDWVDAFGWARAREGRGAAEA